MARAGLGSRRVCEDMIRDGRVAVNGTTAVLGNRADPSSDRITLDDAVVIVRDDVVYYLLNKPRHVVTTMSDPQGRPTVAELVPNDPRVFPVGRLDFDSEGLLLLTNDGDLAHLLMHPSSEVTKVYMAEVKGIPSRAALRMLREGVDLDDGRTAPARARLLETHGDVAILEVVIHEGRNRQVRRMCDAIGHPVRRLVRTRIGSVGDSRLAPGAWRSLRPSEVHRLYELVKTIPLPDS